jgi:predicted ester cyclase
LEKERYFMSSEAENRELMREIVHSYPKIVAGDMEVLHRFFHPDLKIHTPLMQSHGAAGQQGFMEEAQQFTAGIFAEGFESTADVVLADEDLVAAHWTLRGKHSGQAKHRHLGHIESSGDQATFAGVVLCRIRDGKVSEFWRYDNMFDVLLSSGMLEMRQIPAGTS